MSVSLQMDMYASLRARLLVFWARVADICSDGSVSTCSPVHPPPPWGFLCPPSLSLSLSLLFGIFSLGLPLPLCQLLMISPSLSSLSDRLPLSFFSLLFLLFDPSVPRPHSFLEPSRIVGCWSIGRWCFITGMTTTFCR